MDNVQLTIQLGPGGMGVLVVAIIGIAFSYMVYRNTK